MKVLEEDKKRRGGIPTLFVCKQGATICRIYIDKGL